MKINCLIVFGMLSTSHVYTANRRNFDRPQVILQAPRQQNLNQPNMDLGVDVGRVATKCIGCAGQGMAYVACMAAVAGVTASCAPLTAPVAPDLFKIAGYFCLAGTGCILVEHDDCPPLAAFLVS